jgi:redoxin
MCIPIADVAALLRDGAIELGGLARALDRPLALDVAERAACLGASARERAEALASQSAPDFTLPDLDGRPHTLSSYRGKKILLVAWASW